MATVYDLYRIMEKSDVYTESEMLEVKVLIGFLGTVGFSPRGRDVNRSTMDRDQRYEARSLPRCRLLIGQIVLSPRILLQTS